MRILIVGADGKGSFEMRGRQLGHAIGARVTLSPSPRDFDWADVIVLVKRAAAIWGERARLSGVPVVWDVVDFWKQPDENQTPITDLIVRVFAVRDAIGAKTLIGATEAMATDIGGVCVPHHCRIGLEPAPPRRDVGMLVVGYEGQPKYLGPWRSELEYACADLALHFVVNPPDLRSVDVVVALRGGRSDGDVCRRWKSGVKYANALVAGRPILAQETAGFEDVNPVGLTIDGSIDVRARLVALTAMPLRTEAYQVGVRRAGEFSLQTVARKYRSVIEQAAERAAA